jgi:hypothetical protein
MPDPARKTAFADTELAEPGAIISLLPIGVQRAAAPRTPSPPIRFDAALDPEAARRSRERTARMERERQLRATHDSMRIREAASAAYANGKLEGEAHGYRAGYTRGTAWGIFCGAFGTCLLVAIAVIGLTVYIGRHTPLF